MNYSYLSSFKFIFKFISNRMSFFCSLFHFQKYQETNALGQYNQI